MSELLGILKVVQEAVIVAASQRNVNLPERQFVVMGGAAYDCEQFVVSGMTGAPGIPGAELPGGGILDSCPPGVWLASVEAAIVRKSCTGVAAIPGRRGNGIPDASAYDEEAAMMSDDFDILRLAAESLSGGAPGQLGSVSASIVMGAAQGQRVATVLSLGVPLWAPEPIGP